MSKATRDVFAAAMALPEVDRAVLAEGLIGSLDATVDPDAEEAWVSEIQRRLAAIEAGQAKWISMSDAVGRLRGAARSR